MSTTYYSVGAAKVRTNPTQFLVVPEAPSKVYFKQAFFTTLNTVIDADPLYMCKLPKGAMLLPGQCFLRTSDDLGTAVSLKVGILGTLDKYLAATAADSAALNTAFPLNAAAALVPETDEVDVIITFVSTGSIAVTAGKYITLELAYIVVGG